MSPHQSHRHCADIVFIVQHGNAKKCTVFSSERSGLLRTVGAPNHGSTSISSPETVISNDLPAARNTAPHHSMAPLRCLSRPQRLSLGVSLCCWLRDATAHLVVSSTSRHKIWALALKKADGEGLLRTLVDAMMYLRRVNDSNPLPSVLQGLVAPPTLSTLHLSLGLRNNLAGWASPHSPCTLYAFERPAPLFMFPFQFPYKGNREPSPLFQKIISVLSRDPLSLGVQAIAFERTKCS